MAGSLRCCSDRAAGVAIGRARATSTSSISVRTGAASPAASVAVAAAAIRFLLGRSQRGHSLRVAAMPSSLRTNASLMRFNKPAATSRARSDPTIVSTRLSRSLQHMVWIAGWSVASKSLHE